ncbi:MAG TPA: heme ABC exporter ATP-binding protein CcmA [Actinobacteria bacterium]|nr:heme ABC exporter ATP-binding protein CcmA [Actinomycetota bacterium]
MSAAIASLESVAVRRPGTLVLRDITFWLEAGEAVGLFGANGSGKTTLLRVLATLLRPSSGTGTVWGARLGTAEVEAVRPRIGLVAHEPALAPHLSLAENLHLVADLCGAARPAADRVLADVGLGGAAGRLVVHCSNGMKRRAEFARILLTRPELLLLDEAHVGLDPDAGRLVAHTVAAVTAAGGAVVLVSHERERAAAMIHRAVELRDGTLTAVAP